MSVTGADIVAEIQKNSNAGFKLLASQYSERIYWHIRRAVTTHQDAEDITQETFLRIFQSLDKLKSADALKSWIYRIATNEALRFIDKRGDKALELDDATNIESDSYVNYSDLEAIELKNAINQLPPKQRMAFNMRYYDELEYEEIASILGTTVHNVRANYHNAKERIIKYMNSVNWNI